MSNAADWRKPKKKAPAAVFPDSFPEALGDSRDSLIDSLTDSVGFSNSPMLAHVGTVLKLIEILLLKRRALPSEWRWPGAATCSGIL